MSLENELNSKHAIQLKPTPCFIVERLGGLPDGGFGAVLSTPFASLASFCDLAFLDLEPASDRETAPLTLFHALVFFVGVCSGSVCEFICSGSISTGAVLLLSNLSMESNLFADLLGELSFASGILSSRFGDRALA